MKHRLRQDGSVSSSFDYRLKFRVLGSIMDRLVIRPQFEKVVPGVLQGLKRHIDLKDKIVEAHRVMQENRAEGKLVVLTG